MGRISNQVGQKDIAGWGAAALVCGALAIFSANIAGLVPESVLGGLHATRLQSGSFNQMRAQMADMRAESSRISREYRTLLTRFNLFDDDTGEVVRRLAAVERSLPLLIESLPSGADIDRSLLTASIAETGGEVYEADGGTVVVRQSPLFGTPDQREDQAIPPRVDAASTASQERLESQLPADAPQGIMLGGPGTRAEALEHWRDAVARAGPLLFGVIPLLAEGFEDRSVAAVAGPLSDHEAAVTLCNRLDRVGIECAPAAYEGLAWPE